MTKTPLVRPGADLRENLRAELARRRDRNRRYSLRAFARQLGVDHAALSQFLRGRRRLSQPALCALGVRLGLQPAAVAACCALEADVAVLRAVASPGFRADSRWLAMRTNLAADAVNLALQRLLAAGALRMVAPDRWQVGR